MSDLEKIIYLADAIEPHRDYPGVDELRKLAFENLDEACILSFESLIKHLEANGECPDENTYNARDYIKKRRK
jgi:HD superfamily phosphohydrolase YqeK